MRTQDSNQSASNPLAVLEAFALACAVTLALVLFFQVIAESENPRGTWLKEGGVIEDAQALLFLLAAVGFVMAMRASQSLKDGPRWRYIPILAWAALMFVAFGEEVSWGQRILGLETPTSGIFAENVQNEINFHNLPMLNRAKGIILNDFILVVGVLLPLVALLPPVRWMVRVFAFPVSPVVYLPVFLGAYLVHSYQIYSFEDFGYMPREYSELLLALGFALFAWRGVSVRDSLFRAT